MSTGQRATKTADELLRDLILRRFGERFEHLPYSAGYHVRHCDSLEITETDRREGVPDMCDTCEYVAFRAVARCEHTDVAFGFDESGRLDLIIRDLAEMAEAGEQT